MIFMEMVKINRWPILIDQQQLLHLHIGVEFPQYLWDFSISGILSSTQSLLLGHFHWYLLPLEPHSSRSICLCTRVYYSNSHSITTCSCSSDQIGTQLRILLDPPPPQRTTRVITCADLSLLCYNLANLISTLRVHVAPFSFSTEVDKVSPTSDRDSIQFNSESCQIVTNNNKATKINILLLVLLLLLLPRPQATLYRLPATDDHEHSVKWTYSQQKQRQLDSRFRVLMRIISLAKRSPREAGRQAGGSWPWMIS